MVGINLGPKGATFFAPPKTLAGKAYKKPTTRIPMAGSSFMLYMRGFQAASRGFMKLDRLTMDAVYKSIRKIADKILLRAQKTCPVLSSKLAYSGRMIDNSRMLISVPGTGQKQFIDIHIAFGGGTVGVDYAVYVHEGHVAQNGKWVRGKPWLVRAARAYRRSLFKAVKWPIQGMWNKFAKQVGGYHGVGGFSKTGAKGPGYRIERSIGASVTRGGI